jgi:hypothetical protein
MKHYITRSLSALTVAFLMATANTLCARDEGRPPHNTMPDTASFVRYIDSVDQRGGITTLYEIYMGETCGKCSIELNGVLKEMRKRDSVRHVGLIQCNRRKELAVMQRRLTGFDTTYGIYDSYAGMVDRGFDRYTQAFLIYPDNRVRQISFDEMSRTFKSITSRKRTQNK